MSEFLVLGWNAAIPEVDIGDDIVVIRDENDTLRRIQVKTSVATLRKNGYSGQCSVSLKYLMNLGRSPVHFVFLLRHRLGWSDPVIVRQDRLLELVQNIPVQKVGNGKRTIYFSFTEGKLTCMGQDFTRHVRDFTDFPFIGR